MRRMQRLARRGKLLGLAPLGQGQGGGVAAPDRFIGPPYYLINDTFTTNRSAGAVNGTNAEPGPGRRNLLDSTNQISISGGQLVRAGGGLSDPVLRYVIGGARVAGRVLTWAQPQTSDTLVCGYNDSLNTFARDYLYMNGASTFVFGAGNNVEVWGVFPAPATLSIVTRVAGAYTFANGKLLWISATAATLPIVHVYGVITGAILDYIRVPATLWLPTPLVSDGFSAWGTSDGLGHAEGIAGGLGAGGGGLWPYTQVGSWQASGGVASASALSGGDALAYMDVETLDVIATVKVTRSGGEAGVVLRGDANNHVRAVHNGTNAQLIKRVSGSDTTLINSAATYVAGAEIRVICEGQKFRLFYNNAFIGTEQTIVDAALNTDGYAGIFTTDIGNTFDDFVVYARGTGGEYAALDAF